MVDERLSFLLEGRQRLQKPIGEVVDELHDLSSAASVGSRALGRLETQADDAGDELRSVASQAGVATTAVAGLDTVLSRLDDVQVDVDVDVDSPSALDLDTTRRVALDVDRAELRAALNSMDDEQIAINPVLRDFETTLADAATAPESDLAVDRERTVTTRTENQLAAAAAQAALGDLGATVGRAPDDVTIDVQTEGVTGTLDGLRMVRAQLADLDDEDARVSVTLDVDRSALDRLSDLDLGFAGDSISPDVDTGGERTVDIATDMDIRGTQAHLRAVESALSRVDGRTATAEVEVDTDRDTSALSVLRGGGDRFDFDMPGLPGLDLPAIGGGGGRRGETVSEFFGGAGDLGKGALKTAPGASGVLSAAGPLGPAGIAGGGAAATVAVSLATAGVSGALGTIIGGGGLITGIGLPVYLNTSDQEIKYIKDQIQSSLDPLRSQEFDDLAAEVAFEVPDLTGEFADAIADAEPAISGFTDRVLASIDANQGAIGDALSYSIDELAPEFGDLSVGAIETLPGLIRDTTDSARGLLSFIDDAARASGPLVNNMVALGEGAGNFLGPLVIDALEFASTMSPVLGMVGDFFSLLGSGLQTVGRFEKVLTRAGDAVSIFRALGGGPLIDGPILPSGWIDQAQWTLDQIYAIHNSLNDLHGASTLPSISAEDLEAPELQGYTPGGGRPSPTSDAPSSEVMTASAVASLPSQDGASSAGTSTAQSATSSLSSPVASPATGTAATPASPTASATPVSSGGGSTGGDTYITNNNYDIDIDNSGSDQRMTRMKFRRWLREANTRTVKQNTPGGQ